MVTIRESKNGLTFEVRVTPHASRTQIAGIEDEALKVKVTAQPREGEANAACVAILAKSLGLKRGQVEIISGVKSRKKIVLVKGTNIKDLEEKIKKFACC